MNGKAYHKEYEPQSGRKHLKHIIEVQYINLKNPQTKNDQTFDQASHRIENQNGQAI